MRRLQRFPMLSKIKPTRKFLNKWKKIWKQCLQVTLFFEKCIFVFIKIIIHSGISSPEKSAPPEPEIEPQPEPERKSPRSKRKSAQTAELKIRENQSEDYNLFQSPIKPKPLKETPKSAKEFNTTTKPVPNSFVSPRSKRLSAMTKVEVPVMNTEVETKEEKESNDSKDDKESKKNCSTEKIVPAKSSVSNTKPKRTASKPLQYRLVDETAVSEDSVDPTDIPEVKSLEGGRRSRRSRGSVSDPVTPAKGIHIF